MKELIVAKFNNKKDNRPRVVSVSVENFFKRLKKHDVRDEKNGECFSPVEYLKNIEGYDLKRIIKNSKGLDFKKEWTKGSEIAITDLDGNILRSNKNVRKIYAIVLDFDDGTRWQDMHEIFKEFEYLIYSTFSNTPEHQKWRLVLPFEKPVSVKDYKTIWPQVMEMAGNKADPSCKDAARLFFMPSCPEALFTSKFAMTNKNGHSFIDIEPTKESKKTSAAPAKKSGGYKKGDYKTLDAKEWFKSHDALLGPAAEQNKHYVKCPWGHGHTDGKQGDTDTVIWMDKDKWPTFNCSHAHCDKKAIKDVMDLWGDQDKFCEKMYETDIVIRALGFDTDKFYYQCNKNNKITSLTASQHTKANFFGITPKIEYWGQHYFNDDSGRISWDDAARDLIEKCFAQGFFQPENIRGSGVWKDDGKIVAHLGDRLWVDGKIVPLTEFKSDYIYECSVKSIEFKKPLSFAEAKTVATLADQFEIASKTQKALLSGMVVSGIIGSLTDWRSHMWINGEAGTGKSQVLTMFLAPLWGPIGGLSFEGESTAAGIRQHIRHNGVPVMLDEPEAVSPKEIQRVDDIISLVRSASTNSIGVVAKGTSEGKGQTFRVKAPFVLCSIANSLDKTQDKDRFSIINIEKSERSKKNWPYFKKKLNETFSKEFSERLFSRVVINSKMILKNIDAFHEAIVRNHSGASSRWADQQSTLLAGHHFLTVGTEVNADQAWQFFKALGNWEEMENSEYSSSEAAVEYLKAYMLRDAGSQRPVTEYIQTIVNDETDPGSPERPSKIANQFLARYGIKVQKGFLCVANNHPQVKTIFNNGGYSGHSGLLALLEGALSNQNVRFSDKKQIKSVKIPLGLLGYEEISSEPASEVQNQESYNF